MTLIVMSAISTLVCEIISYIFQIILFKLSFELGAFIKIILIELLFNSMIIIIIYPMLQKAGMLLEKVFTENKILTRYY